MVLCSLYLQIKTCRAGLKVKFKNGTGSDVSRRLYVFGGSGWTRNFFFYKLAYRSYSSSTGPNWSDTRLGQPPSPPPPCIIHDLSYEDLLSLPVPTSTKIYTIRRSTSTCLFNDPPISIESNRLYVTCSCTDPSRYLTCRCRSTNSVSFY